MKIFFDHQIFSLQNFGGASRIFAELIPDINNSEFDKAHLSIIGSNNIHLKEKNYKLPKLFEKNPIFKRRSVINQLNNLYTLFDIQRTEFDIYHATYYDDRFLKYVKGKPTVVTFLDMIHERFHEKFPEISANKIVIDQKRKIAHEATHIIAISENTKKDVVELYGIKPEKVNVVHLGSAFENNTAKIDNSIPPFILYVGNREAYKNFQPMMRAIANVLKKENVRLICAGGKAFNNIEHDLFKELKVEDLVIHENINDEKLGSLYVNAIAMIFPSLYEGFGIPVLEAFSCNCPVLLSNQSSLPEVGGDAVEYFDPYNQESMKTALEKIIDNEPLRIELISKGQNQLKGFSWHKQTIETLKVYKTLL